MAHHHRLRYPHQVSLRWYDAGIRAKALKKMASLMSTINLKKNVEFIEPTLNSIFFVIFAFSNTSYYETVTYLIDVGAVYSRLFKRYMCVRNV